MIRLPLFHTAAALLAFSSANFAAEESADPPPKAHREHDTELTQISVIDKLLSIEASLGGKMKRRTEEDWAKDYEALYQRFMRDGQLSALPGAGSDDAIDALALGIKSSDAVVALKARDVEALNLSAEQIEQLALKLGATKKELERADTVKQYANKGRWLDSFLALGFLQKSVLGYLKDNPAKKDQAVLVVVGGWLQGGRCVTHVISQNYNAEVSNILREPRFVDLLKTSFDQLPKDYFKTPVVKKISDLLPEIKKRVNVGFHEPVKEEDVKWLHQTFEGLVTEIAPKGAEKASTHPDGNKADLPAARK